MRNLIIVVVTLFININSSFSQKIESFNRYQKGKKINEVEFMSENTLITRSDDKIEIVDVQPSGSAYSFDHRQAKSIAFPDTAAMTAFGDSKGKILIYKNKELISNFQAHPARVQRVKFSPSKKYLATAGNDSKIKVWLSKVNTLFTTISVTEGAVTDIAFSLNEKYLIYSTSTGKIGTWSLIENKVINTYQAHKGYARALAISPDSLHFASSGDDKKMAIYTINSPDFYCLEKAHKNIIPDIHFINKDYLISIGHDHRIIMNNIRLPTEKEVKKHFKGNIRYSRYFYDVAGDKYLSSIAISDTYKKLAVSSFGKGVMTTEYFHRLIEQPHSIKIHELGNSKVDTTLTSSEYIVNQDPCIIKGQITRPEEIKNAWIYFIKDDTKIKLRFNKRGEFKSQLPIIADSYSFRFIIEDWDKNIGMVEHDFILVKEK